MSNLPITEDLDFHYLLGLMPPLQGEPEFSWLPELFAIIGHEKLIQLCKYAGGERIMIPTLGQLLESIEALQWFYDVDIKRGKPKEEIPEHIWPLYLKISNIYDTRNN